MRILGIHDGHGAGAALLENGKVVKALEEERFTRIKGDSGFPKHALDHLLREFGDEIRDVASVAVASCHHDFVLHATKRYPLYKVRDFLIEEKRFWIPTLLEGKSVDYLSVMPEYVDLSRSHYPLKSIEDRNDVREMNKMRQSFISGFLNLPEDRVVFVDHHTCHAHHAYFSSPLRKEALILTMDGFGDGTNATVHVADEDGKLRCLYRTALANLGRIYQFVTLLLGMKPAEHEYKVMGLAAYAKEHYIREPLKVFEETYYVDGLEFKIDRPIKNHYQYFKERLEGYRFDAIAGALQRYTENLVTEWVKNWIDHTGLKQVVFSGGVALNIKLSKRISELPQVRNIFVCMAGGDESLSIGAAQYQYSRMASTSELLPIGSPYLGVGFDSHDIRKALEHPHVKEHYRVIEGITSRDIAKILADGHIVGVMTGESEFGPRALGHRSFLADPRDVRIVRTLNEAIKNRDFWMPFTPSILEDRAKDYLVNPKNLSSPYMTMAFDSTDLAKRDLAAAIHAQDMTLRPQIVTRENSPRYYETIKAFENETGVGGLLNTSLNIHGKPIVLKPIHLVEELLMNELIDLKFVVFENVLIRKRGT